MSNVKGVEASRIMRAVGVLSSATMLSRVLGLVRDAVIGAYFGAGGVVDAFLVAFRLPNMLRSLFAEGSLTVSFIPVFVELDEKEGAGRANQLGRVAVTLLGLILAGVVAAGVVFAPLIVRAVAMGFTRSPEKFALTVELTRMVFPYIGLVGLTAIFGGILNARGVFLYPALAPVALNVCIIAAALSLSPLVSPPVASLCYGVLAGGVCQLLLQLRPASAKGFDFRPDFHFRDPALKKVFMLMGPGIFGVAVYQVNLVVSTFLASWLPDGSVSYLYFAERIFQLPLGVFAVSVGVASLPSLSRLAAKDEWEEFGETVRHALRLLWFIVAPASAGLLVLALPIVALLFMRGNFDIEMARNTAWALYFYALALLPVATTRVAAQAFYAMKDMRTPVKGASIALVANLAASLLLMGPLKHAGLALATALAALANATYLSYKYRARTGSFPFTGLGAVAGKILVASFAMASAVAMVRYYSGDIAVGGAGFFALALFVGGAVMLGVILYAVVSSVLGLEELGQVLRRLRRKL